MQCSSVDLPEPGRAHDGGELAGLELDVTPSRAYLGRGPAVDLDEAFSPCRHAMARAVVAGVSIVPDATATPP